MAMYWCLGMYGSASTWTFNVVRKLAAAASPERPVTATFVSHTLDELGAPAAADTTLVVKTHAATCAAALAERARRIIVTVRDPRDAIASLMAHNKAPFELALRVTEAGLRMCGAYAADPRALLLRFEDRFFEAPHTITRLAATLPHALSPGELQRIHAETRREAIDAFIAGLETLPGVASGFDSMTGQIDTYDPRTGWHKHHAGRKGESGRWRRELTPHQTARIEDRMLRSMRRFGYAPAQPARGATGDSLPQPIRASPPM
jgi:hypothetical protein